MYWGSAVNDLLEEPGHTPLYVGLPSAWGPVDGDLIIFFPSCRKATSFGDYSRH
jgi:hypothetical protein